MAIPKPTYDDFIKDYDEMQTDEINEITKESVITFTNFLNGWVGSLTFVKMATGFRVTGTLTNSGSVVANRTVIGNIPENYRPSTNFPLMCVKGNVAPYNGVIWFILGTNGNFEIRTSDNIPANTTVALTFNQMYF